MLSSTTRTLSMSGAAVKEYHVPTRTDIAQQVSFDQHPSGPDGATNYDRTAFITEVFGVETLDLDADYDFILVDCPPALSLLTLNGLCAAHGVIIPMQCEYYALEGLSDLVNTIKKVHANLNTDLKIIGLLRVMFDPRMTLSQQVSNQLEQHFGDKVFKTIIPRNVRLAEAPSYGIPGVTFDPSSKGAQAYIAFGAEMVQRIKTM